MRIPGTVIYSVYTLRKPHSKERWEEHIEICGTVCGAQQHFKLGILRHFNSNVHIGLNH